MKSVTAKDDDLRPEYDLAVLMKDGVRGKYVKLYETELLSLRQAAKLAGFSKLAFMELLGKHGVAVYDYPEEDLEQEMDS